MTRCHTGVLFVLFACLVGCAGKVHYIGDINVDVLPSDNADQKLSALERTFSEAVEKDVPFLSPTWYSQARESFNEAKAIRAGANEVQPLFNKIEEARIEIDKANELAAAARKVMGDVAEARRVALRWKDEVTKNDEAAAMEVSTSLQSADSAFLSLGELAENGRYNDIAEEKGDVIASYMDLGGRAAETATLESAKKTLETTKYEGGPEYAPQTLRDAEAAIQRAESFTKENPQRLSEIKRRGAEAFFYADRALQITLQAKKIGGNNAEQVALGMEETRMRFARETSAKNRALQSLTDENRGLSEENDSLAAKNRETEEKDARINGARELFLPVEAEVVTSERHLIIRLKSLEFAVGKAHLQEGQFGLLAKVQEALKLFPGSEVIVEGHTDSVGSDKINKKLSEARARTVLEYLVSNQAVDERFITSVGRGSERPIADNKTAAGRAANRRIDILVSLTPVNDRVSRK